MANGPRARKDRTMGVSIDRYLFHTRLFDKTYGTKVSIWDYEDLCKFYHMWN